MSARRRNKPTVGSVYDVLNRGGFADARWENLGVFLGVPSNILENIRLDKVGQASSQLLAVLEYWINNDLNASWEKLAKAVKSSGYANLANSICNGDNTEGGSRNIQTGGEGTQTGGEGTWSDGRGTQTRSIHNVREGNNCGGGMKYVVGALLIICVVAALFLFRENQPAPNGHLHRPPRKDTNDDIPEQIEIPRQRIKSAQDLVDALNDVADWISLCSNLNVNRGYIDTLKMDSNPGHLNRQYCLYRYYDSGMADWAEVVAVVAKPPISNIRLACQIAVEYIEGIDQDTCLKKFNS